MSDRNRYYKEAKRWSKQAAEDLTSAEILFENERYYLVCFLSQQIAEKALKAVIYYDGEDIVLGHSVKNLIERVSNIDIKFKQLKDKLPILDSYYIPTRYPNGLPDGIPADVFTQEAAMNALELAKITVELVQKHIKVEF
jgi:HEPN domain-containing protein